LAVEWPEDAGAERWMVYVLTVIPAAWRALENWRKNFGPNGTALFEWGDAWAWAMSKLSMVLLLSVLGAGCSTLGFGGSVTTAFSESYVDEDGTPTHIEYNAKSTAGAFGKLDDGQHTFRIGIAPDGSYEVVAGQAAAGIDNTGNAAALKIMADALNVAYTARLAAQPPALPSSMLPPVERGETADEWLRRVQQIEEVLRRFGFMAE
jgi:hypothetical protein